MKRLCVFLSVIILSVLLSGCSVELPDTSVSSDTQISTSSQESTVSQIETQSQDNDSSSVFSSSSDDSGTQQSSVVSADNTSSEKPSQLIKSCTVTIDCKTVLANMDKLKTEKKSIIPSDGMILAKQKIALKDGDTAFDVLSRITKKNKIHMESSSTPGYNSKYIEGIGNLYEFNCGELSGWEFAVNGKFCSTSSSNITVSDGDDLLFVYTCDLGKDVGNENGGQK